MHTLERFPFASIACFACSMVVAIPTLATDITPADDIALDLSLPADLPMVQNSSMDNRDPVEPLPSPILSAADVPILGSALDLDSSTQVGQVPDASK